MVKTIPLALLFTFSIFLSPLNATQNNPFENPGKGIFKFDTELCSNIGYFDDQKYSIQQIQDTYKLWFQYSNYYLETPMVFQLKDLEKVRSNQKNILQKLDHDYQKISSEISALKVVNTPFWTIIKKKILEQLKKVYELKRIEIQAYSDPKFLINNNSPAKCKIYAEALNNNDENLMQQWKKLRIEMSERNVDPDRIMNEFYIFSKSQNKRDYAIIDLVNFGWWNCNNNQLEEHLDSGSMQDAFYKLFTKVEEECDEP